jgi:hypothetical protein
MDAAGVRPVLLERKAALESELAVLTEAPRDPMGAVSFGKRVGEGTNQAVERIAQTSAARSLWAKLQDVERAREGGRGDVRHVRRLRRADRTGAPRGDRVGDALRSLRIGARASLKPVRYAGSPAW